MAGARQKEGYSGDNYSRVPSVHDETPVADYPDWKPEDTRVVRVGIGESGLKYKANHFANSTEEARSLVQTLYGRILAEEAVPGQAFFRVMRVKKA